MRATTYLIPLTFLVACTVPTAYLVEKTALQTPCSEDEVTIVTPRPKAGRGDFDWDANCMDQTYHCKHRIKGENIAFICQDESGAQAILAAAPEDEGSGAPEPAESAPEDTPGEAGAATEPAQPARETTEAAQVTQPQPATAQLEHLTREEIMAVLRPQVPRLRECLGAEVGEQPVSFTLEINADGSASFQSASPQPSQGATECLVSLVGSLQFRATTDESMFFTTPPIRLDE